MTCFPLVVAVSSAKKKLLRTIYERSRISKMSFYVNFFCFLLIITDLDQPKINSTDTRPVEGTRVYLSCFVDGKPSPTISWTVNGSPLNTSRNSRVSPRNENKQLTIMNLDRTDSGEYQCVAHNILGNVSSNSSTLSVQCKRTFCPFNIYSYKYYCIK